MNMRPDPRRPLAQGLAATRIVLVVVLTSLITIGASATIPGIIGAPVMAGPTGGGPQPRGPGVSAVPTQINHQGVVAVNGQRFNGDAQFKFALVDPGPPEAYLWTNDGSAVAPPAAPAAAVTLPVIDGLFNVRLGDTALTNMTAIPALMFNNSNVVLRVWFDDGPAGNPEQQLSPDQTLTSVPYAMAAATSPPIGSIIAWHKNFPPPPAASLTPPLPDGWLECDGVTVIADGPLAGQTMPGLNPQGRFLRGSATSGTVQTDATALPTGPTPFSAANNGAHSHTFSVGTSQGAPFNLPHAYGLPNLYIDGTTNTSGEHSHNIVGGDSETRPVNMSVVWIMRIK